MSKKTDKTEQNADARQALWEKYLENYKAENPVKFEAKQKNGEFSKIPASFLGVVRNVKGKDVIY